MRARLVAVVAVVAIACQSKRQSEDHSAEAAWRHVEELAAPLSKAGPTDMLDEARKVVRGHKWSTDKSYPELAGVILLLQQWHAEQGGIVPTGAHGARNALEYRTMLTPIVKSTKDPVVLDMVDTMGRRFLEQGASLVDGTVGVMVMREVALRKKALGLPHNLDVQLWSRGAVRMIAAEAVAIQTARTDPKRPKPSPESVLDADANLAALTAVLGGTTLETDWETLLAKLRAAPVQRPATKALVGDIIEMIESDRKLAAELAR